MIQLSHVSKSFDGGKTFVVNDVSLTIETGETLVVLGSSGSGKTTILNMINHLIAPTRGDIFIDGENTATLDPVQLRRRMGYVFQGIGLFPHMSIADNITVVLRLLKVPKNERDDIACQLLSSVNLNPDEFADRLPDELSGGQQQRVGVARALANKPDYLLMDEPFGALDSITRNSLQEEFLRLKNQLQKTVVFVTHDIFEALRIADRIAIMHDGQLEQVGTAKQVINHPKTDFVRDLFAKPAKQLNDYAEQLQ